MRSSLFTSSSDRLPVRRPWRRVLVFVALTLLVLGAANAALTWAVWSYKPHHLVVLEAKRAAVRDGRFATRAGAVPVLFFGNSITLAGLQPQVFDTLSGHATDSWNLGLPALPISAHYYVLRDYLARNPAPGYIVLQLAVDDGNNPYFDNACEGAGPLEILALACYTPYHRILLNYFNPRQRYSDAVNQMAYDAVFARAHLADHVAQARRVAAEAIAERGYYLIQAQAYPDGRLPDDFAIHNPEPRPAPTPDFNVAQDSYVEAFFQLAQAHQFQVLLIEPPVLANTHTARAAPAPYYRTLLDRYPNAHLAPDGWRSRLYEPALFADPVHLNRAGAAVFTNDVYRQFAAVFPRVVPR
ncbi:MAG: hypothetical protein WCI73_18340 [Phycisphaerae bacterium]